MDSLSRSLAALVVGVVVVVIAGTTSASSASDVPIPECCSLISGSCRYVCEQVPLVEIAMNKQARKNHLQNLTHYCTKELTIFWQCINGSLEAIQEGEGWIGRPCCKLPQSHFCRLDCLKAKSRYQLSHNCRRSDEMNFFNCVQHQEDAERCCSSSQKKECRSACWEIFSLNRTPNRKLRDAVVHACAHHSQKVLNCVNEHKKITPAKNPLRNIFCCDKSADENCRRVCRSALTMKTSEQEIVEVIESACGSPRIYDQLWQCFLQNAEPSRPVSGLSRINRIGIDGAKLQCCLKAVTSSCRKLCFQTFGDDWSASWQKFDRLCISNGTEPDMSFCLTEVDEPCKLGCEGLSYCSNFNDRSVELFQRCTVYADHAARQNVEMWQKRSINIPFMQIRVQDIKFCHPEIWKAIACILQIKPCHQNSPRGTICKSDCINILTKCLDYNHLHPGHTPETLCDKLSPEVEGGSCVSIAPYLTKSPDAIDAYQITHPCVSHNCNVTDVCIINHDCLPGQNCLPFKCHPGCKVGDSSHLVVPYGAYIQVPVNGTLPTCYKICRCSDRLMIEDCTVLPCSQPASCWNQNKRIDHNKVFETDCNKCICYNGKISCSKFICANSIKQNSVSFTGLPCECAPHYVPVCGADGKTYPSACIASCMKLQEQQMEFGSCSSIDPCEINSCPSNQRCIPRKTVCLSINHHPCLQYECVDANTDCSLELGDPVCSLSNEQFMNFCHLMKSNATLGYRGKCKVGCDTEKTVCGQNGETYRSECAAWANGVKVDYSGPCLAVGTFNDGDSTSHCVGVRCQPLSPADCVHVIPPGACCPVCGGGMQILYSKHQVDYTLKHIKDIEQITVDMVIESLKRYIETAECVIFSHKGIHNALIVVVAPIHKNPTPLQVKACVAEAEKISVLIQNRNAILLTDVVLLHLVAAGNIHVNGCESSLVKPQLIIVTIFALLYSQKLLHS